MFRLQPYRDVFTRSPVGDSAASWSRKPPPPRQLSQTTKTNLLLRLLQRRRRSKRPNSQRLIDLRREVHHSIFHHQPNLPNLRDVLGRIALEQHEVRELAALDAAEALLETQILLAIVRTHA